MLKLLRFSEGCTICNLKQVIGNAYQLADICQCEYQGTDYTSLRNPSCRHSEGEKVHLPVIDGGVSCAAVVSGSIELGLK